MYFEPMKVLKKFAEEEGIEFNFKPRKLTKRLNEHHQKVWRGDWEDFDRWRKGHRDKSREQLLHIQNELIVTANGMKDKLDASELVRNIAELIVPLVEKKEE